MVRDLAFNEDGLEIGPARCLPEAAAIAEAMEPISEQQPVPHTSEDGLCGPPEGEKEDMRATQPAEAEAVAPPTSEDGLCGPLEGEKEDMRATQPAEVETLVPHTSEDRLCGPLEGEKEDMRATQPAETLVPGASGDPEGVIGTASWPYMMRSPSPPDYGVSDPCSLETLRERKERYANYARATLRRGGEPLEWDNYLR